jgi:ABC-type siderophore export system fused ATPase/permease subunit
VGCGKTTRLVKIEREVAEEQASLAAEAKADRSYFQIVKDVFYKHSYMYSALIITAAIGSVFYYHKPKHIEELLVYKHPVQSLQEKNIADMPIEAPIRKARVLS